MSLSYPYIKPQLWFVHEISQSINGNPYSVFIEANKWLSEKMRLPLKHTDQRFQSVIRSQIETAELVPRETREHRLFHSAATNRRSNCLIGPNTNRAE